MSSKPICLDAPNLGTAEKLYLAKAVDSGYVSTAGPFVPLFEKKMAGYLGAKYAVSTQSGTAALHMALHELRIGAGDEVIVPALTFVASVNPITYVKARPVFVDVDPGTFNIDPKAIELHITKRTRAILPVHLYGNPCDMGRIMDIAKRHHVSVIEDATESLGARYRRMHTGTFGDFGCLSFNGNKTITTGGGGMVIGRDKKKIEHIKFLVNQAREDRGGYYHPEVGFNYRMTNIEAALGLAQIERLRGFLRKKREFNAIYRRELSSAGTIIFQEPYACAESSYWMTCVLFPEDVDVAVVQKRLARSGIPSRRIFMPLTESFPYKTPTRGFMNAYRIFHRGLSLPSSTLNTEDDIVRVCDVIKKVAGA